MFDQLNSIPNLLVQPWTDLSDHWPNKIQQGIVSKTHPLLVSPTRVEALAQVMSYAYSNQWRVIPCGGGSKLNWGGIVKDPQIILSTQYLNQILDHAVSDLTVTVEAGLKLADLQVELAKFGQFLALDPAYPETATIGGIVATGDSGSYRKGYRGVRDLVLGLSWIRSDGELAKAGGKVVKNVAGYDLMKLFTGSYGTLGIITSITFRLYPLAKDSQTVLVTGEAVKITSIAKTIRQSSLTPTMADLLSEKLINRLELGEGMGIILRFQTISESIQEQVAKIKELGCLCSLYEGEKEATLWQQLKQTIRQPSSDSAITCKIGIKPNQATSLLTLLDGLPTEGLGLIHLGSGVGYLQLTQEEMITPLRSYLETAGGFLSILEAPLHCKENFEPWGYTGNALEMMRKLKEQFDPFNLLSPGRFVGNI